VPGTVPRPVERYAPLVYLDGDDAYPPSNPADFLDGAHLAWSRTGREEDLVVVRDPVDLDSLLPEDEEEGFVSDAVGEARRFFRRIRARKPPRFPVLHEGDWERISVRPDEDDRLAHIACYQHNGPPELVRPRRRGERPVVYVAKGSHASYPNPSRELSVRKLVKAAEVFGKDIEWQVEPQHLRDVRREKWFGFGGAWGRPGADSQQTGPIGPSRFKPPTPFLLPR
jgi:hypothetical protein